MGVLTYIHIAVVSPNVRVPLMYLHFTYSPHILSKYCNFKPGLHFKEKSLFK